MLNNEQLKKFLINNRVLFSDGAMGTILSQRLPVGQNCLDCANLTNPQIIETIHREYIEAGADMVQTNTFGANRFKLAQHGLEDKLQQIQHRRGGNRPSRRRSQRQIHSHRRRHWSARGAYRSIWKSTTA